LSSDSENEAEAAEQEREVEAASDVESTVRTADHQVNRAVLRLAKCSDWNRLFW